MKEKTPVLLLASLLFSSTLFSQVFPTKIGVGLDGIGGKALEFPNVTLTAGNWQSVANNGSNATTDAQGWRPGLA